jgi:hypothetical protein
VLEWGDGAELDEPELDEPELEEDDEFPDRPGIRFVMSSTMLLLSSLWCPDLPSSPEPDVWLFDELDEVDGLLVLDAVAAWAVPVWWSFQYIRPPRPNTATALRIAATRRANHARGRRGPA